MDVIGDGIMASEAGNSICRKELFQMFCHPSQPKDYAKLKINEEMGFEVKEKKTYRGRRGK